MIVDDCFFFGFGSGYHMVHYLRFISGSRIVWLTFTDLLLRIYGRTTNFKFINL